MAEGLTKKQIKELRKLEKQQTRNLEQKNNNVKWIAIAIVGALCLVLFIGALLVAKTKNKPVTESGKVEISDKTGQVRMVRSEDNNSTESANVITIVEYADLQCPACKSYHPIVKELLNQYPDRVRLIFKHFPLVTIHPNARPAAIAAEAAGRQNKFFEFVDLAYEKQGEWSALPNADAKFNEYAKAIGLNVGQFVKDRQDPALEKIVDDQREEGFDNAVTGTPTFFINNEKISSPASLDAFKKLIDERLKAPAQEQAVSPSTAPTTVPDSLPLQQ